MPGVKIGGSGRKGVGGGRGVFHWYFSAHAPALYRAFCGVFYIKEGGGGCRDQAEGLTTWRLGSPFRSSLGTSRSLVYISSLLTILTMRTMGNNHRRGCCARQTLPPNPYTLTPCGVFYILLAVHELSPKIIFQKSSRISRVGSINGRALDC